MNDAQEKPAPDLEVGAGWRARSATRRRNAEVETRTSGDARWSQELSEREPEAPKGRRWRLRAWLRDPG